jgi:hypothetical protein
MRTLTVTGTNLAGKPDTGDEAIVLNAANWQAFGDPVESANFFYHGIAKFSVPEGTYWAVGGFQSPATKTTAGIRLVVLPQFRVQASQVRVHMAARAATSELGASTPRPGGLRAWAFAAVRGGLNGTSFGVGSFGFQGDTLWINPTTVKPTVGSLNVYDTQTLASPATAAGTPYVYNLAIAGPAGIVPDLHAVIAQRSLATVTERFYQDITSTGATITVTSYPVIGVAVGQAVPVPLPGLQTEYMTGTIASVTYNTGYNQFLPSFGGGQGEDVYRPLRAGQKLTENWNNYPLHPQPFVQTLHGSLASQDPLMPTAFRKGDKLSLFTTAFSDNVPGHTGAGFFPPFSGPKVKVTGSYAVYQDGVRVAHGSPVTKEPFAGLPRVPLSHKASVIRFVLAGARRGKHYVMSPAFRTVWTWRSRPEPGATVPTSWFCGFTTTGNDQHCAVQPMMTLNYIVQGMSLRGTTTAGRQVIGLDVGHLQLGGHAAITSATVQASFDGGRTWHTATVTRAGAGQYTVSFTAPAGAMVTLRTHATDAAGGSITETIQDAYQVR